MSEFVENAVRQSVLKRQQQLEFIQRGLAAIEDTRRLNNGIAATDVLAQLDQKLATARKALSKRTK